MHFKSKYFLNKNYIFIITIFLIIQSIFEIIFYHDFFLPSTDIIYGFEKLRNLILFDKSFISFNPNSSFYYDKFDLYEFYTVYLNKIFFYNLLNFEITIDNFILFEIYKKILFLVFVYYFFYQLLNLKSYALFCVLIILIDGCFSHTLHNTHFYLILSIFLSLVIFSNKKYFENSYFKIFLIGFILTIGAGSIVSTGLVLGLTCLIIILDHLIKKKCDLKIIIFFILGCLIPIIFFFLFNYKIIIEYKEFIFGFKVSQNNLDFYYIIKSSISNLFYFLFGQHGNNFLTLYLVILFFNRNQFSIKHDIFLIYLLKIFIISYLFLGLLIDPLHYYPSRLGIITPIVVYLLIKLLIKEKLIFNKNLSLILCFLIIGGILNQLSNYNYFPDTTIKSILVATFASLIFLFSKKKLNNNIIFVSFFIFIIIKFFPNYRYSEIQSLYDRDKEKFIENNLNFITKSKNYNCIATNYALRKLFKSENLLEIKTNAEHLNKKGAFGNIVGGCDILVLIVDKKKRDLDKIKKVNFIKKNIIKNKFNTGDFFTFRAINYEIIDIYKLNNLSIYFSKIAGNKSLDYRIYLSID